MVDLTLLAPAKLNLFLHIVGKRADGYHQLQTIFTLIDLFDELSFSLRTDNQIVFTADSAELNHQQNLVVAAATLLQAQFAVNKGITIHLAKRIPLGAGLGGGSSDAATTLLALNQLWQLNLSQAQLLALGKTLGADVPIFIFGQPAWAEGIGDQLTPIDLPRQYYLLVFPGERVDTKIAYADPDLVRNTPMVSLHEYQLSFGHNDFEPVVFKHYPRVFAAYEWLKQYGAARMTGSGSTLFLASTQLEKLKSIKHNAPSNFEVLICRGLQHDNSRNSFQRGVAKR